MLFYSKGDNSKMGDNSDKKNTGHLFFHEESIQEIFKTLAYIVLKLCYAPESATNEQRKVLFVLRFYGPVNPMGSCQAWLVYLITHLLGRLSPLSSLSVLCTFFHQKLTTTRLESAEGRE